MREKQQPRMFFVKKTKIISKTHDFDAFSTSIFDIRNWWIDVCCVFDRFFVVFQSFQKLIDPIEFFYAFTLVSINKMVIFSISPKHALSFVWLHKNWNDRCYLQVASWMDCMVNLHVKCNLLCYFRLIENRKSHLNFFLHFIHFCT